MDIEILNLILLLAATQGFFLTILIIHKHRELYANRFLALLMFFFSMTLLNLWLSETGLYLVYPQVLLFMDGFQLVIFPLYYLYARYLIHATKKFNRVEWFHFLPFLIYKMILSPSLFSSDEEILNQFDPMNETGLPFVYLVFNWVIIILGYIYMFLITSLLKKYTYFIKSVFSTIEKIRMDWLQNITYLAIAIISIFFIENILFLMGINLSNFFGLSSILAAIYIYTVGYWGLSKSGIFTNPDFEESVIMDTNSNIQDRNASMVKMLNTAKKYEKSGLSTEKAKQYFDSLLHLMEEKKPYKNSELTLTELAFLLSIKPHNLSEVINTQMDQNFFDFVNQYRVEQVKRDLADPKKQHFKILSIAIDCGFNSKSSFNTIFKKFTNMTPSQYRNQLYPIKQ